MRVKIFSFSQYHNKRPSPGSTKIRVENLIKKWPEASLYHYGEDADVFIFQKVYVTYDYKFIKHLDRIKILDVCDPDWTATPDIHIKETLNAVNAVVVPTKNMQKLIQQMTDKPVRVIKDRFLIDEFPARKVHKGKAKKIVWFGYAHNSELLKFAIPAIERRGLEIIAISNEDPQFHRWAGDRQEMEKTYKYYKYGHDTVYKHIQEADICVLPQGNRPMDKYKSENRTVIAQLCGVPVVTTAEKLDELMEAEARNKHIDLLYNKLRLEYDVSESVKGYQELIDEIRDKTNRRGY